MGFAKNYPKGALQKLRTRGYVPKWRPCLGSLCMGKKRMWSEGASHRVCQRCKERSDNLSFPSPLYDRSVVLSGAEK